MRLRYALCATVCAFPLAACSTHAATASGGHTTSAAGGWVGVGGASNCAPNAAAPYPTIDTGQYAATYRMRVVGSVSFQSKSYSIVNSMPIGDIPTSEPLYKITLYKVAMDGTTTLLGTLSYTQQPDKQWIPTASGPEAHSLNDKNGRWIINGPIFKDRGERAVAVIESL